MGQKPNKPRLSQDSAMALARRIRGSPRKMNLITQMIRGQPVEEALTRLTFCSRRLSNEVKKVLQSAIANAQNNHDLDVDRLNVVGADVGKAFVIARFRARARGRGARIQKPVCNLRVIVQERPIPKKDTEQPIPKKNIEQQKERG